MIKQGVHAFAGKRILLLQGPVGPFFAHLARAWRGLGSQVYKINFNAGDWFFYPRRAMNYRGTLADWPQWLEDRLRRLEIDVIFLFGDCRPIHRIAHAVAIRMGVEVGVFEEGYVRPDYVTLERFGVNGHSLLPRVPDAYKDRPRSTVRTWAVGNTYWPMAWYAFCYFGVGCLGGRLFPHYRHHRALSLAEGLPWIRSIWRKHWYRWRERGVQEKLVSTYSKRFFLVPLQVFNDAQVTVHADLKGVEHFIEDTIRSFARHAPEKSLLVFKHHPMDRGYRDYTRLIQGLGAKENLGCRVIYIHDQHLPTLLDHACGVVVINSTVGISALHHNAPTLVRGTALYDIPGLTYQGTLDEFWTAAPHGMPDRALYQRFRSCLITTTQLNGSFYKPLKVKRAFAGLVWEMPARDLNRSALSAATQRAEEECQGRR
ncbi:capsule biosynthesis protein [Chitiniphilus shinanonensis]|uniref:capsule biosynthesis protein n=1 Tax=Chitiniphilus shinanonensis TaxID=553088 RepID=UPI00302728C4